MMFLRKANYLIEVDHFTTVQLNVTSILAKHLMHLDLDNPQVGDGDTLLERDELELYSIIGRSKSP